MGVDQLECGAGRASPTKWSNTGTGTNKIKPKCRSLGCGLQCCGAENDRLAISNQAAKFKHTRRPYEQFEELSALV
jgi:hypothetical protein